MPMGHPYQAPLSAKQGSVLAPIFTATMIVLLLLLLFVPRTLGNSATDPLVLSLAGSNAQELLILDPRSGNIINQIHHAAGSIRQVFVSPRGDKVLVERLEEQQGSLRVLLELRTLPDWSLLATFPVDSTIPALQRLAAESPVAAQNASFFAAAFSREETTAAVAFFVGQDWPALMVTTLDLEQHRWADWSLVVPAASNAWLFPSATQLLVVSSAMLPQRAGYLALIHSLDPRSGAILAEQRIPFRAAMLPQRGQVVPSTSAGLIAVTLQGEYLHLVTEDLTRQTVDARTLELVRVDPALFDTLAAFDIVVAPDQSIALVRPDELVVIDNQRWQITHHTKLPSEVLFWTLVGYDPARPTFYLASEDGCLRRFELSSGTLSQPVVCGLSLDAELRLRYGWPAFVPVVSPSPAAPATMSWMENLASLATAVLAATFALAALSKGVTWRTSIQQLAAFMPPLSRRANVILAGVVAAEASTAALLLLPATHRFGLVGATSLLLIFLAVSLRAVRRSPTQPCPCFGPLGQATTSRAALLRNLTLLGILALAWADPRTPTLSVTLVGLLVVLVVLNAQRLVAAFAILRGARQETTVDHAV